MAQSVREVMTKDPVTIQLTAPVVEAARLMRQHDVGDVIVMDGGQVCGIVTDRDIVVRAIADGKDPSATTLDEVCTRELVTLSPDDSVGDAVRLMSERAIRRLPVVEGGTPVGIVTIGDLAMERDPDSALADISKAPPNQ
jgi:CBS domain-containing protein